MPHITKGLLLFALVLLVGGALAACTLQQDEASLRATLSALETTSAQMAATTTSTVTPTNEIPNVPLTGAKETAELLTEPALPLELLITPGPEQVDSSPTSDLTSAQPSPTLDCPTHESDVRLSASKTTVKVGEVVEVKARLVNTGCVALGLPQYRLAILNSESKPIFSPDKPDPIIHSLGVPPGRSDQVTYLLEAVSPGKATLSAVVSFEVHLGYPGPAYWGTGSAKELVIQVEP